MRINLSLFVMELFVKEKHPILLKITALSFIVFIIGGYFSMVSRVLGQQPSVLVQNIFMVGTVSSLLCGFCWTFFVFMDFIRKRLDK